MCVGRKLLQEQPIKPWTAALVIQSILELKKANQPIGFKSIGLYKRPAPDPILTEVVGKPTSRKLLYQMACNHFGSWDEAITACALPPPRRPFNRFWNREIILKSIQTLKESGHPLNVTYIWRDRSVSTSEVLLKITGKSTTGSALHDAARRYFGSWDNALEQAGIPVPSIKEKTFWTREKILDSIRELHKHGLPLNSSNVDRYINPRATELIKNRIGKERHTKSLYGAATRSIGSWDRALQLAGLNPDEIRLTEFKWTKSTVKKAVHILHSSGVPLNAASISKDKTTETNALIFERVGRELTGSALYRLGLNQLGSWDNAIRYSGFFLSAVRKRSARCERNRERLIEIIRSLSFHEFPLNSSAISRASQRMRLFNEVDFGQDISGLSMLNAAKLYFSSWQKALWEAGLDPSEICLRSSGYTSNLPVISLQREDTKDHSSKRRIVKYIGPAPKTAERILEEQEAANYLQYAVSSLSEEDQEILELVFDEVLRTHHHKDQEQLIKFIAPRLGAGISQDKISQLFGQLANTLRRNTDRAVYTS
jgi:hypothetical protein